MKIVKKFLLLFSFSFDALSIIFGILNLYKISHVEKKLIFDFSIFSIFFLDISVVEQRIEHENVNIMIFNIFLAQY